MVRSVLHPRAGRAAASSRFPSLSQDRRPVPEVGRRSPASAGRVRGPGPRPEPALSPAEPSSVRRGASWRKLRVLGPVPRVPALPERPVAPLVLLVEGRPEVRRAPSPNDRPAAGRPSSRAGGRAARRTPSAEGGRAVRRAPPAAVPRVPSVAGGRAVRRVSSEAADRTARRAPSTAGERDVRRVSLPPRVVVDPRARSGEEVRVVRRGPSLAGVRGLRRAPSLGAPSRPVCGSWPRPTAVRPRPELPEALVPVGRGLLRGVFDVPAAARAVFGTPRPPPVRPPPLAPRPLGVSRPSATPTNLQHLPPPYPDKRRGPLDLIGSDPLHVCPAASYSPTRSPAQYHRR